MSYMNNIKKLYLNIFFHNLMFAYVIERLFWEQRGMTVLMVVYAEIIYAATVILFEIPTGIIADKWSRKKMMVIGALMTCMEWLLIIHAHNFWHFAIIVFLAGISNAMVSGSQNALLYDSLKMAGCENEFEKTIGRLRAFDFSAALIAALSGAFLANRFGLEFNYWLSLISSVIALGATLSLVDIEQLSRTEPLPFKDYVFQALQVFKNSKALCIAVLSGVFLAATVNYLDEFWQIYLDRLNIPVIYFGLYSAFCTFVRIPGSLMVDKLSKRYRFAQLISVNILVYGLGFIFVAVFRSPVSIVFLVLINMVSGIAEPVVSSYLHHRIDSSMRATIDSFQSLGQKLVTIVVGLAFGYCSTKFTIFGGFGVLGILSLGYYLLFTIVKSKIEI